MNSFKLLRLNRKMGLLFPDEGFFSLHSTCAELVEVGLSNEKKTKYGGNLPAGRNGILQAIGKSLNEFYN